MYTYMYMYVCLSVFLVFNSQQIVYSILCLFFCLLWVAGLAASYSLYFGMVVSFFRFFLYMVFLLVYTYVSMYVHVQYMYSAMY